jgi:hypothetical protein
MEEAAAEKLNLQSWCSDAVGACKQGGKHSRALELHPNIHGVPVTERQWEPSYIMAVVERKGVPCRHDVRVVDQLEKGLHLAALLNLQENKT